ncbi:hypothetical protein BGZ60DRAFT_566644 [Tricladium varicosporioides]|nr:hypothetical protein BGZ60DRAFT_566644 [Hymenoscyphus varicosporioides]
MSILSTAPVALVAIIHTYILILEMFLWTTPYGRKAFRLTSEFATQTRVLAANQGLYNGFLAAGLFWSLSLPEDMASQVKLFFLGCVAVAGVFGGATVSRKTVYVQSVPAVLGVMGVLYG